MGRLLGLLRHTSCLWFLTVGLGAGQGSLGFANDYANAKKQETQALSDYYQALKSRKTVSETDRAQLRESILKPRQTETIKAFDRTLRTEMQKAGVTVMDSKEYRRRYGDIPKLEAAAVEPVDYERAAAGDDKFADKLNDAEIDKMLGIGEVALGIPTSEVIIPAKRNSGRGAVEIGEGSGEVVETKTSGRSEKIVLEGNGPNEIIFERTPSKRTPASF